jgi:hypothetical protein
VVEIESYFQKYEPIGLLHRIEEEKIFIDISFLRK